jgi:hypothetical protein
VVFDELHKYPHWKNSLKGLYDQVGEQVRIIVTGSARLDLYKKGGDSLLGRYIPYRLHPFSVAERPDFIGDPDQLEPGEIHYPLKDLIACSGFPEPLLLGSERKARRWSRLRLEQLVREDIEVDFCVVCDGKPWMLVECKSQSTTLSRALIKFSDKFPLAAAFQLTTRNVDRVVPGTDIRIINIGKFLSMLI